MSLKSGEYPQPQLRPAVVQAPVVPAYTTVRLYADLQFNGTLTGTGTTPILADNLVLGLFENVGSVDVTVQLRQVGDYAGPLSARSNVGNPFTIVAGGRKTFTFTPQQRFLELWGITGVSDVKMQFETQVAWGLLGFAKNDPYYPPQLWAPSSTSNI